MRTIMMTAVALSFAGAMAIGTPSPAQAQTVYLQTPGMEMGVGPWRSVRAHRYFDGRTYGRDNNTIYHRPNRNPSWAE